MLFEEQVGAMFVLIRLTVIVGSAYAGNAFAGWQFLGSTHPTFIYETARSKSFW